mgnify:CR=1 FL=1
MNDISIRQLENRLINTSLKRPINAINNKQFEDVQSKDEMIKFSKHAIERMESRNIELNEKDLDSIKSAFKKAEEKGIKDALIIIGDKGFIASIKNKTIITSMTSNQIKDNVFTNIDGAVIL